MNLPEQIFLVTYLDPDERTLAAVTSSYDLALAYCEAYRQQEPTTCPPFSILALPVQAPYYHLYPQDEPRQRAIEKRIGLYKESLPEYYQPMLEEADSESYDGLLLLVNQQTELSVLLGTFPDGHTGGQADLFSEAYLGAYPDAVVEFWPYRLNTIYHLPVAWSLKVRGWPPGLTPDQLGTPYF